VRRLLRVETAGSGPDYGSLRVAVVACTERLVDIRGDTGIAGSLQALIDACIAHRSAGAERAAALLAPALRDQTSVRRAADIGISASMWEQCLPLLAIEIRSQREGVMRSWIDQAVALREHPDPATWPALFPRSQADEGTCMSRMRCRPAGQRAQARRLLRASLLVAELRGAPWPRDWFDPAGAPLRRIERDGRLIGAYSVGDDGVDNHGAIADDQCWALYERLGAPRGGDALPATVTPRQRPAPSPSPPP
jgi:hypothetical protein